MDERIQRVCEYLEANPSRRLLLRDLAQLAGVSVPHLCYLFKRETGMTPGSYAKRVRMDEAKALLVSTPLSVKGVSFALGFTDERQFVRAFRKIFGLTPGRYRSRYSRLGAAGR